MYWFLYKKEKTSAKQKARFRDNFELSKKDTQTKTQSLPRPLIITRMNCDI